MDVNKPSGCRLNIYISEEEVNLIMKSNILLNNTNMCHTRHSHIFVMSFLTDKHSLFSPVRAAVHAMRTGLAVRTCTFSIG